MKLIMIPFAGGNINSYKGLIGHLANFIEPVPLELPGHGQRLKESLLDEILAMVEDLFSQIKDSIECPYAIYGHSLGACLGYLLTHNLVKRGLPPPCHLFFFGAAAPKTVRETKINIHLLSRAEFVAGLRDFGGIPPRMLESEEWLDVFEPIIRADFQALDKFEYGENSVLDIPISVVIGEDDEMSYEEALLWGKETTDKVSVEVLPGGHFFIFDHPRKLGEMISSALAAYSLAI